MARQTTEEKLLIQKDHYENVLETLVHEDFSHITHLHFNAKGDYFLTARKFQGKLYSRLSIAPVNINNGDVTPPIEEIANTNEDGNATARYIAPSDKNTFIVKSLTIKEAKKYYEDLLKKVEGELSNLFEPVPKAALKAERKISTKAA